MMDADTRRFLHGLVAMALSLAVPSLARAQAVSGSFNVVCVADPRATEIRHQKGCVATVPRVAFGDEVTLAVEHAPEVDFDDSAEPDPADLVLFLGGKPLPGTNARVGLSQLDEDLVTTTLLTYRINRDLSSAAARASWKEVIVGAKARGRLAVSTGLEDGPAAPSRAQVEFVPIRRGPLLGWCAAAAAGLVLFFFVAARTGALRDVEPPGDDINSPRERAFSLARVQMALWTILAFYAYLYVWFLTGEYNATIPASIVALMGIALATYGSATAVDATKNRTIKEKLEEVKKKQATHSKDVALAREEEALELRARVCKSETFWRDIVTSAGGASLHRLQFILWTLGMAVIFVATVYNTLALPDFDTTLLALMGLTSGTYVGLKLPENKT